MKGSYIRFLAMIATSTIVMFGLMYLNTYDIDHAFFSETRSYMALYMGAATAVIMLAFMLGRYTNRAANITVFTGSIIVFAAARYSPTSSSVMVISARLLTYPSCPWSVPAATPDPRIPGSATAAT